MEAAKRVVYGRTVKLTSLMEVLAGRPVAWLGEPHGLGFAELFAIPWRESAIARAVGGRSGVTREMPVKT